MANKAPDDLPDPTGRNADKRYYRSGKTSVIKQSRVDTNKGSTIPVPQYKVEDRSTDKYYRETTAPTPGSAAPQLRRARQMQSAKHIASSADPAPPAGALIIRTDDDVRPVCEQVIERLLDPSIGSVKVHILGASTLGMRVRTYLDLQVGRERISEAQYRDVAISIGQASDVKDQPRRPHAPDTVAETRSTAEIFGDPAAARATMRADEDDIGDVGDFLKGDDTGDFLSPPQTDEAVVVDPEAPPAAPPVKPAEEPCTEPAPPVEPEPPPEPPPAKPVPKPATKPATKPRRAAADESDAKPLSGVPSQPKRKKGRKQ